MPEQATAMKARPEFLDGRAPAGIEVYELAPQEERAVLVYPDRPAFLEGGRQMLLNTASGPQIVHLDEGGALQPVRAMAPDAKRCHVAPGGRYLVYAADEAGEGRLVLRRLDVRTGEVEEVFAAEGTIADTPLPADKFVVQAVSWDATRFAGTAYLGYGKQRDAAFGITVLEAHSNRAAVVAAQPCLHNSHMQYCRQAEAPGTHDLMIQMNHGAVIDEHGKPEVAVGPPSSMGVDIHVVQDDGTNWRDLPFGRDGVESCIGHQVWRGQDRSGVTITFQNKDTSYGWAEGTRQDVVAGWPVEADPDASHAGRTARDAHRVCLSEGFDEARFCHLGVDDSGLRFAFDTFPIFDGEHAGQLIYLGSAPDMRSPLAFRYILNTGVTFGGGAKGVHAHPILSPGGRELFFNS
ncbi:MAG: hypothetical protein ACOC9P_02380, partial [bacterium]